MISERYEHPTAGGRTLVLSPSREPTADRALFEVIAGERPRERSVLAITYDRTAESFAEAWREYVGVQPCNLGVVDVNAVARSVSTGRPPEPGIRNVVATVADPNDLRAVVDAAEVFLDDWGDEETAIYVDSLTGLLHRVGIARSVGFVDALGDQLESRGCAGYVRLERDGHDAWVHTVLGSLFDSVLELTTDGEPRSWTTPSVTANEDGGVGDDTARPALDQVFDALGHRDRRLVLHTLRQSDRPLQVSEVAEWVVAMGRDPEEEVSDEEFERTYVGLRHLHFPKLERIGVIAVDPDDTVRLGDAARRVDPFLTLTVAEDLDV